MTAGGAANDAAAEERDTSLPGEIALIFGSTFSVMALFGVGLILPAMRSAFAHTSEAGLVAWVATVVGPAFAFSSPLAARAIERYGYRLIYLWSIGLYALVGAAPVVLDDPWIIVASRLILGVATAGAVTASLDGIGRLPPKRRSLLFGLQTFAGSVFSVAAFPSIGYLLRFGWHAPFAIYLFAVAILPLALTLPSPSGTKTAAEQPLASTGILAGLSPTLLLLGGTVGLIMFTGSVFSPVYLGLVGITGAQHASLALTLAVCMTILSSGAYGVLHRTRGTAGVFVVGLACIAGGFVFCGFATSIGMFIAGLLGYGAGIGLCAPNVYTWAVENGTQSPGRMAGAVNVAFYLVPVSFPYLFGGIGGNVHPGRIYLLLGIAAAAWAAWFAAGLASAPARDGRRAAGTIP